MGGVIGISSQAAADDLGGLMSACLGAGCPAGSPAAYPQPRVCFNGVAGGFNSYTRDAAYTMLVGGDLNVASGGAEFEGRIIVRGALDNDDSDAQSMGSVGAGSCVVPPDSASAAEDQDWITVGGAVDASPAINVGTSFGVANVRHQGALTGTVGTNGGMVINQPLANTAQYDPMMRAAQGRSQCWAGVPQTTGASVASAFGTTTFSAPMGGLAQAYTFNLNGNVGGAGETFNFVDFPAGSTVLINVDGAGGPIDVSNANFQVGGVTELDFSNANPVNPLVMSILWNFVNTSAVVIGDQNGFNTQFGGSILVPDAGTPVTLRASTNGRLIAAGTVTQGGGTQGGLEHHSYAFNGALPVCDWGDLPEAGDDYPTTAQLPAGTTGAAHIITPGLLLGACVDADTNGQQSADATGDDSGSSDTNPAFNEGICASGDDEDGVVITDNFDSTEGEVTITTTAPVGGACLLAFFDWNGDGDFGDTVSGAAETGINVEVAAGTLATPLTVTTPYAGPVPMGTTLNSRFRLLPKNDPLFAGLTLVSGCPTSGVNTAIQLASLATGTAQGGEVEDYQYDEIALPVDLEHFEID